MYQRLQQPWLRLANLKLIGVALRARPRGLADVLTVCSGDNNYY